MSKEYRAKKDAQKKLETLFEELLGHDGFGDLRVEMRLLKRGQKEVIIYCGKQYRYVVDFQMQDAPAGHRDPKRSADYRE
ncbi:MULTISPECIES: hypothetical protein [Methylomonas]|uniref:Uncharacterized protein n=2 Tax=Methylomonas TaxID=416 RepID=A0A140E499_9GAMM|nr:MULTISPECIES: hypothetical protein [Methylomonas]AMK75223.1 hypothetical protein JT25_001765 [Methylomonas denitrificans]OAH99381.1 hypothetical protein A1342_04450 [Methylomonas methanica]TCV85029.1 hypothetical protein EDE11_106140 [Methylomonas methanica]